MTGMQFGKIHSAHGAIEGCFGANGHVGAVLSPNDIGANVEVVFDIKMFKVVQIEKGLN